MADQSIDMRDQLYLTFSLSGQKFGTPINDVLEINQLMDITPVPKVPSFVCGVMNLRGKVIPVIDLRLKFESPVTKNTKQTSIVVIDVEDGHIGTIVDDVHSVIQFDSNQIELPPAFESFDASMTCIGLGKLNNDVYILVNLSQVLSKNHFEQAKTINFKHLAG
jgi:purine-binding chemotaxis protein CheW